MCNYTATHIHLLKIAFDDTVALNLNCFTLGSITTMKNEMRINIDMDTVDLRLSMCADYLI